jgi:allophanate hydrolase
MAGAVIEIVQAGPLVTVQDGGRPKLMRYGVPASGPMDRGSFAIANAALGNPEGAAGIEVSVGGLALDCVEGSVTIALAGGGFRVTLDGHEHPSWIVATLAAGMRLTIRPGLWGNWTYLGFAGRLDAKPWLGSVSTHGPSGFGGGRLAAGQRFAISDAERREARVGELDCPVSARPRHTVKVVLGPQDRFFAPETIETLLSAPFTLTGAYDRMGARLAGPSLRPDAVLDMPSEPIMRGSIQVSGDGAPAVLLADHQTTGGYPKIATVIADHLDGFVQLRSRAQVAFSAMSPQAAVEAARTRRLSQARFLARLRGG